MGKLYSRLGFRLGLKTEFKEVKLRINIELIHILQVWRTLLNI